MKKPSLWRLARELNADGRLALFVGAGISMGCGLPSWRELVSRVLATTWKGQPDLVELLLKDNNILAARYARQKAGAKFNRIVHDALYRDNVEISRCVWAIARSGTNHAELLDRAVWRRFQLRMNLPGPNTEQRTAWFERFEARIGTSLGISPKTLATRLKASSFSDLEQFCEDTRLDSLRYFGPMPSLLQRCNVLGLIPQRVASSCSDIANFCMT